MMDALVEKILSGEIKPNGKFGVGLKDDDNGFLSLKFNVAKRNVENYYLVLANSKNTEDKIVLTGVQRKKDVLFDVRECEKLLDNTDVLWLAYIAFDNEGVITYSRLINADTKKQNETINITESSDSISLFKINKYIKSVYKYKNQDKEFCIYINQNVKRATLAICNINNGFLPHLIEKGIWSREPSEKKSYEFTFSVVMAIYNVEAYLDETIHSILNQDIGFEEHIQMILVDDGSSDGTPAICDKYGAMYPDNIMVIHKPNGGVASARNEGKKYVKGKYVNFFDSDDLMTENVFSTVFDFFEKHYKETDAVTIPIYFFDASEGPHWQNYKFKQGSRVIDLWKDYNTTAMVVAPSFFKNEVVNMFEYDPTLPCGEDAKYIVQIILEKMTLGVVTGCSYMYRRRVAGGSLINTLRTKKSYYFEYFDNLVFGLFEYSRKKFGFIPYFIQNNIMSDLQWRFGIKDYSEAGLDEKEISIYLDNLTRALQIIDDKIIEGQIKLSRDHKIQLYKLKYGENSICIRKHAGDIDILRENNYIVSVSNMVTQISNIQIEKDLMTVEGFAVIMGVPESAEIKAYIKCGSDYFVCDELPRIADNVNCFGQYKIEYGFSAVIPVKKKYSGKKITVCISIDGAVVERKFYRYGKFSPINLVKEQYYIFDNYVMEAKKGYFHFIECNDEEETNLIMQPRLDDSEGLIEYCKFTEQEKLSDNSLNYEEKFLYSLYTDYTNIEAVTSPITNDMLTNEKFVKIAKLRRYVKFAKKERPIWIISDRIDIADDNGKALFSYLMTKKDLPVEVYFTIRKDCADYEKMKTIGPVLEYGSEEHLRMHLIADCVVSSMAEDSVFTPFEGLKEYYGDRKYFADILAKQKFVFLQHGVTKDDLSGWLTRYNKRISGFVTTAYRERDSILEYPYGYNEKEVWLTGFPRFDYMYNDPKNQVVICPTWRAYLQNMSVERFAQTDYFKFYKELIEDESLHNALQKAQSKLVLKIHPRMREYIELFQNMDDLIVQGDEVSYRQIFAESNIMITDYSSTAMDFAYMGKPVVYYQFDKEEFFSGAHTYNKGYFDYEHDGFGPVTENVRDTVKAIVKILKNNCKTERVYNKRRNGFFIERDDKNCERVYNKILEMNS